VPLGTGRVEDTLQLETMMSNTQRPIRRRLYGVVNLDCDCKILAIMVDEAAMDKAPVTIGMIVIAIFPAVDVIIFPTINI
jgi:hypothetical protein